MAHSSTFKDRLEQMERTRNQRLSLLQAEKDLQDTNSRLLASKLACLQCMKRRCLLLQQKVAYQNLRISAFKSLIERFDAKYQIDTQELRVLKDEVEELEKLEKERERLYEMKGREMNVFRENVEKFAVESRIQVNELRNYAAERRLLADEMLKSLKATRVKIYDAYTKILNALKHIQVQVSVMVPKTNSSPASQEANNVGMEP